MLDLHAHPPPPLTGPRPPLPPARAPGGQMKVKDKASPTDNRVTGMVVINHLLVSLHTS